MRLIVTRPEPDDARTARALIRLGHEAILSPMLDIVADTKASIVERSYQAVVVTSSNAVRALAARADDGCLRALPLYAVGDQTALEAKRAGFAQARSAGGALGDLTALLEEACHPGAGALLYAAGDVQSGDLAAEMRQKGFDVETVIVYRSVPRKRLSGVAEAAIRDDTVDGVLLYSRRSATAFSEAVAGAGLAPLPERVALYCLSPAVAAPLAETSANIRVAKEPSQISLFALIEGAVQPAGDGA